MSAIKTWEINDILITSGRYDDSTINIVVVIIIIIINYYYYYYFIFFNFFTPGSKDPRG